MGLTRNLLALLLLAALPAGAQTQLPVTAATGSITAVASCPATGTINLGVANRASLALQVTGTWTATLELRGSVDGVTYTAVQFTPTDGSGSAATTATANGLWTASIGGLRYACLRASAYTSGTAVVTMLPADSGGGSGGGGGSASSVTINDPTITSQKAAVNASGQLSMTCANCSGSGASAVDNSAFTAGTTSGAPAMGFFHSTIDTVADGRTATLAMDAKRSLFTVLRDAAGNARGVNVTAGNALTVDASATTQPVSGTFWQATQPVSGTFFQATQAVSNAGTFAVQLTGATNNVNNIAGTVSLPTGAAIEAGHLATIDTVLSVPTTVFNGKTSVTTAGTRVTLAAAQAVKGVTIKALSTNTGFIYVGNASVAAANGLQLRAGESVSLAIANLNTVNLDSSVNGEGVTYLGVN